jgi:membrane peptidoglycan carboxypeptidase
MDPRTPPARGVARVTPSSGASSGAGSRARGSASVGGAAGGAGRSGPTRNVAPKAKKGRRRLRRISAIAGVTALLLMLGGMSFAYVALQVPLPSDNNVKQLSRIYYSDGKTLMAALGSENRTYVTLDKVPVEMQRAIIAAEDRTFYQNNGISMGGIARAAWANVRGQEVQGGSTITQQYVKNAHLTDERTLSRKFREIGWAIKANQKYSKAEILEFYLNTIYFGRGAHGIQAAAEAYFGVGASKLTVAQSAVLAGIIKAPSVYDPAVDPSRAKDRWDYVLESMVGMKWLTPDERAAQKFPKTRKVKPNSSGSRNLDGWSGLIVQQVEKELKNHGIDEQTIRTGGLKIVTTIDKTAQDAAVQAAADVFEGQPKEMEKALAAVEPGTGRVKAYYGGERGYGNLDLASSRFRPGSSFKAYTLAAAIADGVSIKSYWNGSDNQAFPGETIRVQNSDGESCARCNLIDATVKSLNTTYYALTQKVGAQKVLDLATASGVVDPKVEERLSLTRQVALGDLRVSPLSHADGFATFAAGGVHAPTYFVERVDQAGKRMYTHPKAQTERAFSADVAADATYAMQQVYRQSTRAKIGDGRPAAGKTGTAQLGKTDFNSDAWMCGFTPQLAAAVWVGHSAADAKLVNAKSGASMYGAGLPRSFWAQFMSGALQGKEKLDFPPPKYIGIADSGNVASPEPVPTPTATQPTQDPIPTAGPTAWPIPTSEPQPSPEPSQSSPPLFPDPSTSPTGGAGRSPGR